MTPDQTNGGEEVVGKAHAIDVVRLEWQWTCFLVVLHDIPSLSLNGCDELAVGSQGLFHNLVASTTKITNPVIKCG